jgi:hypothetical protein
VLTDIRALVDHFLMALTNINNCLGECQIGKQYALLENQSYWPMSPSSNE